MDTVVSQLVTLTLFQVQTGRCARLEGACRQGGPEHASRFCRSGRLPVGRHKVFENLTWYGHVLLVTIFNQALGPVRGKISPVLVDIDA